MKVENPLREKKKHVIFFAINTPQSHSWYKHFKMKVRNQVNNLKLYTNIYEIW